MLCDPHVIAPFHSVLYSIITLAETPINIGTLSPMHFSSTVLVITSSCSFAFIPVAISCGTFESCLNKLIAIKVQVSTDCPNFSLRLFHL